MENKKDNKLKRMAYQTLFSFLKLLYPHHRLPTVKALLKKEHEMFAAIKEVQQWAERMKKKRQEERSAERKRTLLVNASTEVVGGTEIHVLHVRRRGLLSDIISESGIIDNFPEIKWATTTSRHEGFRFDDEEGIFAEETVGTFLRQSGFNLPKKLRRNIVTHFRIKQEFGYASDNEVLIRTAHVFVEDSPIHYYGGKFSPTLFMSEYGKGTKIYLMVPKKKKDRKVK